MRIEYKGFIVTQREDKRYHAVNANTGEEFIVDTLEEVMEAFKGIEA